MSEYITQAAKKAIEDYLTSLCTDTGNYDLNSSFFSELLSVYRMCPTSEFYQERFSLMLFKKVTEDAVGSFESYKDLFQDYGFWAFLGEVIQQTVNSISWVKVYQELNPELIKETIEIIRNSR